jgi:type II secretory pathway component PulL
MTMPASRAHRRARPKHGSRQSVEAVLAASQVRIVSLALPLLAPARVAAAATFAVDDQLAGPLDAHHLAVSTQQPADACGW